MRFIYIPGEEFKPPLKQSAVGITGHAPIAAWRKADRTDLGTVGNTASFELLGYEATEKGIQYLSQTLGRIILRELCVLGEKQDFFASESKPNEMVKEEIV